MSTDEPVTDEELNEWAQEHKDDLWPALTGIGYMLGSKWIENQDSHYVLQMEHKISLLGSLMKNELARRASIK